MTAISIRGTGVIAAWPRVVAAAPDARLLIVGGGAGLPQIERLIRQSTVSDRIEVRGFVPEAGLPHIWREAHVFAMPSRGEGFGLVYIEAMRHGLPVIASVHDAGQEINVEGVTGYNVDMDRPVELAKRIVQLLRSPDEARRLGQAGLSRWREHFRIARSGRGCLSGFRTDVWRTARSGPAVAAWRTGVAISRAPFPESWSIWHKEYHTDPKTSEEIDISSILDCRSRYLRLQKTALFTKTKPIVNRPLRPKMGRTF